MTRVIFASMLIACSKEEASSGSLREAGALRLGSCDRVTSVSTCSEYRLGGAGADEAQTTAACAKLGGSFVYAECPNTTIVGACKLSTGEVRKFYSGGNASYDPARAKKDCEGPFHGTWTAQ